MTGSYEFEVRLIVNKRLFVRRLLCRDCDFNFASLYLAILWRYSGYRCVSKFTTFCQMLV